VIAERGDLNQYKRMNAFILTCAIAAAMSVFVGPRAHGAAKHQSSSEQIILGLHAKVLSKMAGSKKSHGHARGLQCFWSEDSVQRKNQHCVFTDAHGARRRLEGLKASFMIDSVTRGEKDRESCRSGECRFRRDQELDCFTLGEVRWGLQCQVMASSKSDAK
jgi:hypothetical protein